MPRMACSIIHTVGEQSDMRSTVLTFFFITLTFLSQTGDAFRCGTTHLKLENIHKLASEMATAPDNPNAPVRPIGFQRPFFAIDFARNQQYIINATLRASGTHCYIYVEDTEWQETINPLTVQNIQRAFEQATPADPRQGIYDILTQKLGPTPDVDGNQRVILLLLNIRERVNDYTTAGYFMPIDQQRGLLHHPTLGPIHSNEADIIYLNTNNRSPHLNAFQGIIAHELQHLIHWKHSPNEDIWVDEGCAGYATFLCGYNLDQHVNAFRNASHISLTDWTQMSQTHLLAHYGASFLFMLYLNDHYGGTQTIAKIVKNRLDGITGVTQSLAAQGRQNRFSDIFADWKVAIYLSTWRGLGTLEKQYRYNTPIATIKPLFSHSSYPALGKNRRLANFASHAIEHKIDTTGQAGLTFSLSTQRNANVDIKVAYLNNTGEILVETLPLKTLDGTAALDIPKFGTTVQRMMVMPSLQIENQSFSQQSITYDYNAFEGSLGTYTTHILPNPIHPNYWEILAVPSETTVAHAFTVTLTYQNRTLLDAKPMLYIQNKNHTTYRYVFHLEPDIEPSDVNWRIMRGETLIDEGVLED